MKKSLAVTLEIFFLDPVFFRWRGGKGIIKPPMGIRNHPRDYGWMDARVEELKYISRKLHHFGVNVV